MTLADTGPMQDALALAEQAIGVSDPNPRVGCVILAPDGRVIGRGHTQQAGAAHAEVMALRDLHAHGESAVGATVYVSLEPCSHHGRTPPCCDALIAAGVARVVMAIDDPNPLVAGRGAARLRAAGIRVDAGVLADAARELNIGFFARMRRGRPWVRLKAAVSLDGKTALPDGRSQWITGSAARADGHAFRKRAGAVLTGIGTVRDDDPRLDVREVPTVLQPLRAIVDARLETPPAARILDAPGTVLIYTALDDGAATDTAPANASSRAAVTGDVALGNVALGNAALGKAASGDATADAAARAAALRARGAEIVRTPGTDGRVDLAAVLADLGARGVNEVHVEAGQRLNGALVRAGLVDEFLIYMAPRLLGTGRDLAAFGPLRQLDDALALRFVSVTPVGDDLRLIARPASATD